MRLLSTTIIATIILGLSSCVLKHNPTAPAMAFKIGPAYTLDSAMVDTSATVVIGFMASRSSSNMRFLEVSKAVDTLAPVVLGTYVLIDSNLNSINRDFTYKTGVYRSATFETYTFKISDEAGYTFTKSIAFTVHPY